MIDILKIGQDHIVMPNVARFHVDRAGKDSVIFVFAGGDAYLFADKWARDAVVTWMEGEEARIGEFSDSLRILDITPKDAPKATQWQQRPAQGAVVQATALTPAQAKILRLK